MDYPLLSNNKEIKLKYPMIVFYKKNKFATKNTFF